MVTSITFPLLSLFTLLAVSSAFAPLRIARRSHPPLQSKSNEWSAADDWASLSDDNNPVDTSTIFNVDLARDAALEMGKSQVDDDARDPEDVFVFDAVDSIINPMPDGTDPPLYDTASSFENYVETQSFIDDAGKEIGLLVRCNESPEDLLVSEGRALPPLTDEERYDPAQLVNISIEKGQPVIEPTTFLSNAAAVMFQEHAVLQKGRDDGPVLDAGAVAKWMSKSLNESVGRHDKRVLSVISRYGLYGSGVLQEPEFESLYMDAVASGLDRQMSAVTLKGNGPKRQKAMMKQLRMDQPGIQSVWRDLSNHGISSPVEMKREKEETEIEQKYGKRASTADAGQTIMDECEILGWDEHDYSSTYFNIEDEGNDLATSKKKGSHVNVELSSDSMTPKRIRDGQFGEIPASF
uniref:Uncharacterized protein n=1 Tax=Odontella aurita TaxID=265563 RepID=A0A7S4N167_9STRA|mmetsp:Transcript_43401/g.132043  ORF Transcript_43401/g.132043 Transcript_43401/m.132043 type:complete len:409 (+) Transcript_43401:104-1330(+)